MISEKIRYKCVSCSCILHKYNTMKTKTKRINPIYNEWDYTSQNSNICVLCHILEFDKNHIRFIKYIYKYTTYKNMFYNNILSLYTSSSKHYRRYKPIKQ